MGNESLFLKVLKKLDEKLLLEDLILIGSWCLHIYKKYFDDDTAIPIKRTVDMDFLIKNPPNIKHKANVEEILKELDFRITYNRMNNFTKFVHPDLEVEFLMNQKGKGEHLYCDVKELGVKAVQLRYLSFLENNVIKIEYEGMIVRVPEPAAFTMHKYIVSGRRLKEEKAVKDLTTAKEMTNYLLRLEEQRKKFKHIFNDISKGWQKTLFEILKEEHQELYEFLKG